MLVCASPECAKPFHRACLDPPPQPSAEKTWLCPDCDDDACAVCGGAGDPRAHRTRTRTPTLTRAQPRPYNPNPDPNPDPNPYPSPLA